MTHQHPLRRLAAAAAWLLLAGALTAPAAAAAPPPGLYGATGVLAPPPGSADDRTPPSDLYRIDPDDGAATSIGSIGHPVTGLAVDPTSGTLYGVTAAMEQSTADRQLIRLDSGTGAGTIVGAIQDDHDIVDVAFDATGRLYGWSTTTDDLVRIGKEDATTVPVSPAGDSGLSETHGGGIAFDGDGALHGLLDLDYGHLWALDAADGSVTRGPELSGSPNDTGGAGMNAAAFGCGGRTLYSIVNDFGAAPSQLVTVSTDEGEIVTLGDTAAGGEGLALDALAWVCAGPAGGQPTGGPGQPGGGSGGPPTGGPGQPGGGSGASDARCGNTVLGTIASDRLLGSDRGDLITGFAGNDRINGRGGDDCINGLDGTDTLLGGDGVDTVDGGRQADRITGGAGRNLLRGGTGNDRVTGGPASDVLQGNAGRDRVSGGAGDDELLGGAGKDRVIGGAGRDAIEAGAGSDRISARDGALDFVDCGRGRDTVVSRDRIDKLTSCERR